MAFLLSNYKCPAPHKRISKFIKTTSSTYLSHGRHASTKLKQVC